MISNQRLQAGIELTQEVIRYNPAVLHDLARGIEATMHKVAPSDDQVGLQGVHEFGSPTQGVGSVMLSHRVAVREKPYP